MSSFDRSVKAKIVSVRFASSGKIARVNKNSGDKVNKGEIIASLDRKILQAELDRQLADYEKVRADFEIFNQKNPNPIDAIDKYLKTEKQASLNASVKDVELAKAVLDQCDLVSPINGVIIDDNSIVPAINVSPTSAELKIVDSSSYYFEIEIEQKDIASFREPKKATIKIVGLEKELTGETSQVFSTEKGFYIKVPISDPGLLLGMKGEVGF